jgi:riboflavin-specific deaminase-like protein
VNERPACPSCVDETAADDDWSVVPAAVRDAAAALPPRWQALFGPLKLPTCDGLMVIGQLGQALDGRVATESGHSHYINGVAGLAHLHRLRAVVDAVVIGVGTAVADDPQLTVRRVAGPNPARVIIDPRGRLPETAHALAADGVKRVVVGGDGRRNPLPSGVELVSLPAENGRIAPAMIIAALAERGFRRLLIEGGADTVSRFLSAGCLDRLHIVVAPIILGTGPAGLTLPPIDRVDEALRPSVTTHILGDEVLFDCGFAAQRLLAGRAKKST